MRSNILFKENLDDFTHLVLYNNLPRFTQSHYICQFFLHYGHCEVFILTHRHVTLLLRATTFFWLMSKPYSNNNVYFIYLLYYLYKLDLAMIYLIALLIL